MSRSQERNPLGDCCAEAVLDDKEERRDEGTITFW
jgi:hypothetical protein